MLRKLLLATQLFPTIAFADGNCERLEIEVTGTLSIASVFSGQVEGLVENRLVLPLDSIGAMDARAVMRVRPDSPGHWSVDLKSALMSRLDGDDGKEEFIGPVTLLDFDDFGRQVNDQIFGFQPISNSEKASQSFAIVRITGVTIGDAKSDLQVREINRSPAVCFRQGSEDTTLSVNGGK